ncbi:MAG TPA: FTR1 family iron permease [Gammaproteobacteria bacterium]|nr:FTR1 family iron permease [Gammaproteobacteria bacterium]
MHTRIRRDLAIGLIMILGSLTALPVFAQSTSVTECLRAAEERVTLALALYAEGHSKRAEEAALNAHVQDFECVEPTLSVSMPALVTKVEDLLTALHAKMVEGVPVSALRPLVGTIQNELAGVGEILQRTHLSGNELTAASFLILLREGIEAVLILASIAAFLGRTGRGQDMRYVHGGWLAALVLGVLSWFAATRLIAFEGSDQELAEGLVALIAAGILLYVGFWLHNSGNGQQWRKYVSSGLKRATKSKAVWTLAFVAFLAVYREVFETVLFYQTLWLQVDARDHQALLFGFGAGVLALVTIAAIMFRLSVKVPLKAFFTINTVLMVVLAVVFTGQGVVALQKAGVVPVTEIPFPQIPSLGVYPDLQSVAAQLLVVLMVLAVLIRERSSRVRSQVA